MWFPLAILAVAAFVLRSLLFMWVARVGVVPIAAKLLVKLRVFCQSKSMEFLASLFVGQPLTIAVIGLLLLVAYGVISRLPLGRGRNLRPFLIAGIAWGIYASWEWLVLIRTPEADIRVDLLLIWPILAIISLWAIIQLVIVRR